MLKIGNDQGHRLESLTHLVASLWPHLELQDLNVPVVSDDVCSVRGPQLLEELGMTSLSRWTMWNL